LFRSKAGTGTGMGMGGAITAVAAITTVGTAVTTMAGGIIAIGGDFQPRSKKGAAVAGGLFRSLSSFKDVRSSVAIADKPHIASTARFDHEWPTAVIRWSRLEQRVSCWINITGSGWEP